MGSPAATCRSLRLAIADTVDRRARARRSLQRLGADRAVCYWERYWEWEDAGTKKPGATEVTSGETLPESGRPDSNRRRPAWEPGCPLTLRTKHVGRTDFRRPAIARQASDFSAFCSSHLPQPTPAEKRRVVPRAHARRSRGQSIGVGGPLTIEDIVTERSAEAIAPLLLSWRARGLTNMYGGDCGAIRPARTSRASRVGPSEPRYRLDLRVLWLPLGRCCVAPSGVHRQGR